MPLEDFFTLTEMKDGLATLARVEDLVGVMKKKGNTIKNAGDAARQWATVASVLVATENKECLNHFIQLDGLPFLDQCLQEAQKCDCGTNDSFSEESICTLLGALEMLPIDNERSTSSGIGLTVRNLLCHKSFKVEEKARALLGSWNQASDERANCQDVEDRVCLDVETNSNDEAKSLRDMKITVEGGYPESPVLNLSPSKGNPAEGNYVGDPVVSRFQHSMATKSSDFCQASIGEDVKMPKSDRDVSLAVLNQEGSNGLPGDANISGSSLLSNIHGQVSSVSNDSSPSLGDVNGMSSDVAVLNDTANGLKEVEINMNIKKGSPSNISERQTCGITRSCKCSPTSSVNDQKCDSDAKDGESCPRNMVSSGLGSDDNTCESQKKEVDCSMPTYSRHILDLKPVGKDDECHDEAIWDLSSNGCISRTKYSPENSLHGNDVFRTVDNVKEVVCESNSEASEGENSFIPRGILNPMIDAEDSNEEKGNSAMELDYGVDDALEVARQVAKEVEQQVVDYRGPFCGFSPEKNSEGNNMQSNSPGTLSAKKDGPMEERPNETKVELPTEQDSYSDRYSPEPKRLRISDNVGVKPDDCGNESEMPPSTTGAQEMVGDVPKSKCYFDLNEDVYTEEIECTAVPVSNQQLTLSAPIPIVAASKRSPGLPSTPLQFEGELGWKGSASTSAFRPPSARRTPDGGNKTSLIDANSNSSKQGQSFPKIDLNVASDENDAVADLASAKHLNISSGLSSRESSLEVSSVRVERPKLDLNRLTDSDDTCPFSSSDWRVGGQHRQNGQHSLPPALCSSLRQPPVRDFDLNDNPLFADISGSHEVHRQNLARSSLQELKNYGSNKLDDPVLSIMGARVEVNRKDLFNQTNSFIANGQGAEATFSSNLASIGVGPAAQTSAYARPPFPGFGYNDLTVRPTVPFPLQMYGATSSVPYMIDSRGTTVIPLGPVATIPSSPFSRPPFLMGPPGAPTGLTGVGATPSCLDLNSGMAAMDSERNEVGSFRQFFVHGHGGGSMEEQLRSPLLHPTGTGMPRKRKDPECGWELNMV